MSKEEIRRSINYYVRSCDRFNLEKLPTNGGYDPEVNEFINRLEMNPNDEMIIDELVDYYFINQEDYEF